MNARHVRKAIAIELLAQSRKLQEVADRAGVDRSTVWRWLQDSDFQAQLAARRRELWAGTADKVRAITVAALDAIGAQVRAGDPEAVREWLRLTAPSWRAQLHSAPPESPEEVRRRAEAELLAAQLKEDVDRRSAPDDAPDADAP